MFPESLTPPYGIWSARNVGASFTVTPPNSSSLRCAERGLHVAREDPGLQAVARPVRKGDRLVERVVRGDRAERAEHLLAGDLGVGRRVGDDGGTDELSVELAAGEYARTAATSFLDPCEHAIALTR